MSAIARSTVTLRFYGKALNPENLTVLLGCAPTESGKTGEVIFNKSGNSRKIKKGFWLLQYDESDALDLEEKINLLLGKLTEDLDVWQHITKEYEADLFCGLFMDRINEGLIFSSVLMKKLGDRNLRIGFDIFAPVNTWPEQKPQINQL
jgi:hypothetical protein